MMKDCLFLLGWELLSALPVSKKKREENRMWVQESLILSEGYIENQEELSNVPFGNGHTYAHSGCSVLAVYNALFSVGAAKGLDTLLDIQTYFERHGIAAGGKFGVVPTAIKQYLESRGYKVLVAYPQRKTDLEAFAQQVSTLIVVAYNSRQLKDGLHAVNIEKRVNNQENEFWIHNGYWMKKIENGNSRYSVHGPFPNLMEAIESISAKGARAFYVLGMCAGNEGK